MLIAAFKMEYNRTQSELTKKVHEEDTAARMLEGVNAELEEITNAAGSTTSYKSTQAYKTLVATQSTYDTRKEELNTQIEYLKQKLESYKEQMKKGIDKDFSFWCLG